MKVVILLLSVALICSGLKLDQHLTSWVIQSSMPNIFKNMITSFDIESGKISFKGCNNNFAGFIQRSNGSIKVGPFSKTNMVCPRDRDDQFAQIIRSAVKIQESGNKKTFYNRRGDPILVVQSIN